MIGATPRYARLRPPPHAAAPMPIFDWTAWLNGRLTSWGRGRSWGFLGDSITAGSGSSNATYAFPTLTGVRAGSALVVPVLAGVAGQRSDQVAARLQSAVIDAGCTTMVLLVGTNDASQGVSLATYQANVGGMFTTARNAGLDVFVCTVPPIGSGGLPAVKALITSYNSWLASAAAGYGVTLVDAYTALVDGSGNLAAAYDSGDGTHPNNLGHLQIAKAIVTAARTAYGNPPTLLTDTRGPNLLANPFMNGAGTKPDGYSEWAGGTGSTPTYSIVNDASGLLAHGRWAQMDFNNTSGVAGARRLSVTAASTGWAVGDLLRLTGRLELEDVGGGYEAEMVPPASNTGVAFLVVNQSAVAILVGTHHFQEGDIGPQWFGLVVPAGTTALTVWVEVPVHNGFHLKARVGELGLFNATALGLS